MIMSSNNDLMNYKFFLIYVKAQKALIRIIMGATPGQQMHVTLVHKA
jgi:hypothetical protein